MSTHSESGLACSVVPRSLLALLGCVAVLLAGCATPVQRQTPQLRRVDGVTTVVIMPLDVELFELTAGGLDEPRAAWTDAALRNMRTALEEEAKHYRVNLVNYQPVRGSANDRATSLELQRLHRAVGRAILMHHFSPGLALPSKREKFDWSLGPAATAIARAQNADYALFLFVRDSYAGASRVAVMVVGALVSLLVPTAVPGGSQVGFASLVDLKSGDIVWFNRLSRSRGDLRTSAAAVETVKALISDSLK